MDRKVDSGTGTNIIDIDIDKRVYNQDKSREINRGEDVLGTGIKTIDVD